MIFQEHNEHFQRNMHQFMRTIRTLSDEQFLQPINGWSPRDVVAHLIGWNRAFIDVADDMRRGAAPAVLIDPGENFSKANAVFVRQYDATAMIELLRELELSYQEFARCLYTVDAESWSWPVNVPGRTNAVSIEWYVRELIDDYENHRQEIEEWRQASQVA